MLFRQLFEPESSTYSYLLACPNTGQAVLIDPVVETVERDLGTLKQLGLRLAYTLDTHIHADHISSSCRLRRLTGCKIALPAMEGLPCADIGMAEDRPLEVGGLTLRPIFTPGHTDTHHCYLLEHHGTQRLFSGDALLIDGCGRTDFQNGNAEALYRSVREKIFTLPDDGARLSAPERLDDRAGARAQSAPRRREDAGRVRPDHGNPEPALPKEN